MLTIRLIHYRLVDSKNTYRKVKKAEGGIASAWLSTECSRQPTMPRESSFRKVEKFGLVLVRSPPLLLARSERLPPAARARGSVDCGRCMQNGPPEQSDVLRFICEENKPQLVSLLLHAGERLPPSNGSAADHRAVLFADLQRAPGHLLLVGERGQPLAAFEEKLNVRNVDSSLIETIRCEKERTGQSRPMLSTDTLVSIRKFCRSVSYEPSKLNLYGLAAGVDGTLEIIKKHVYQVGKGITKTITFERPMMLGILHIFTIRGWATFFCHLGILCWALGCGRSFCRHLMQNKVPCHYYEQYKTLRFGGIKSKGHDSLRIMMNPELYCKPLPASQRGRVEDAITVWTAMWLTISCPFIGDPACNMYQARARRP